jgi:superfamily II DNA or RNA helicase
LEASNEKLFIVFDEAHHAPAPSYRKLILRLRERYPKMALLGLTATPAYTNDDLEGGYGRFFHKK